VKRTICIVLLLIVMLSAWATAFAQNEEQVSLTVTPPFFQITMNPGDYWASAIKVVNTNPDDLTVYATPMDMTAEGEQGYGKFIPSLPEDRDALANWFTITANAITVAPGQSAEIPFEIRVPADASPGGHYGAIMIGNRPANVTAQSGPLLRVSSLVTSLFFVRVQGAVTESGDIREFSADRTWYDDPNVHFTLRFENTGNVHLQPQGSISVYDMWGKERTSIPINEGTEFGNVLPSSTRRFSYSWSPERSIALLGRYTAIVTLAYGKDSRQNATQTVVFWVVPVRETTTAVIIFAALFVLLRLVMRYSVRRALRNEMARGMPQAAVRRVAAHGAVPRQQYDRESYARDPSLPYRLGWLFAVFFSIALVILLFFVIIFLFG
jgi:hypothetical protein